MPYFAYGPNMERAQMKRLCQGSRFVSAARLRDHQLIFPRRSDRWGGGIAGLKAAPGKVVEGVLYEVSEADQQILDQVEDHPKSSLRRVVTVENFAGEKLKAFTYFTLGSGDYPPSRRYMEKLISGAEEHNLSDLYIAQLEAIRTLG
ncbi:MAG: gamma-glutamylcyclotransferase [candidate division NC10 bacterium]|nr:gamma-glutamylcyclotransferase [candidate division NC10 bacterium]